MSRNRSARGWGAALDGYLTHLDAKNRSRGTVKLHLHYLAYLRRAHPRAPWAVTTGQLERLLANPGWQVETRKSCRTVLRGFYRWGVRAGHLAASPAEALDPIRVPRGVPHPTPEWAVRKAIGEQEQRVVRMIGLALHGLRREEVAIVHGSHVMDDLLLVRGKGGVERWVPIQDPDLLGWLQRLEGWAFPSPYGGHLTKGHVGVLISRALPPGWSAHSLRHRAGTGASDGTEDLLAVQQLLGHSRPDVTQIYTLVAGRRVRAAAAAAWAPFASDRPTPIQGVA